MAPSTPFRHILILGNDRLSSSLSLCLSSGTKEVIWYTTDVEQARDWLDLHRRDMMEHGWPDHGDIIVTDQWQDAASFQLIYISNHFPFEKASEFIHSIEETTSDKVTIAVGTGGCPLSDFQADSKRPSNIVGLNWTEPVHTTYFMEIIANSITNADIPRQLLDTGKSNWNKDPYLINGDLGVKDRMFSALLREALFLTKNDYASPADIDRASRNDAGTYLPFAGNFRYMDLMGTYLYGLVMEELNKELSTDNSVSYLLQRMVEKNQKGVKDRQGFYSYDEDDVSNIDQQMRSWSYKVRQLMEKYNPPDNN